MVWRAARRILRKIMKRVRSAPCLRSTSPTRSSARTTPCGSRVVTAGLAERELLPALLNSSLYIIGNLARKRRECSLTCSASELTSPSSIWPTPPCPAGPSSSWSPTPCPPAPSSAWPRTLSPSTPCPSLARPPTACPSTVCPPTPCQSHFHTILVGKRHRKRPISDSFPGSRNHP